MTPASFMDQFRLGVLGVDNEQIDTAGESADPTDFVFNQLSVLTLKCVVFTVDIVRRLVVTRKEYGLTVAVDSIAVGKHRVVHHHVGNGGVLKLHGRPFAKRVVVKVGFEFEFAYRKVAILHLLREDSLQVLLVDRVKCTIKMNGAPGDEQWREEWKALNMVPVGVRYAYSAVDWVLIH